MYFVNENLFVLLVIGFGCLVIGFARFCHWQEKRENVQDRDY